MKTLKQLILITAAFCLSGMLYADEWTKDFSGRNDATFQYQHFLQTSSLADSLLVNKDSGLTFTVSKNLVDSPSGLTFGIYTFDEHNNVIDTQVFSNLHLGDSFSLNFSEGERVAFWLDMGTGAIDTRIATTHATPQGMYWSNTLDSANNQVNLIFKDEAVSRYWSAVISINGSAPTPSGAPLPSVVTTGLLGLLAVVFFAFRKLKK